MFSRPWNPANRFDPRTVEWEVEPDKARLELIEDASASILAHNDSPDIGFSWSVNPYRGCTHACAYCYARPTHEYLGYGAGTDFERKIVYKPRAGALLAASPTSISALRSCCAVYASADCCCCCVLLSCRPLG